MRSMRGEGGGLTRPFHTSTVEGVKPVCVCERRGRASELLSELLSWSPSNHPSYYPNCVSSERVRASECTRVPNREGVRACLVGNVL